MALELSGKEWLAAVWAPDKDRISRHELAANDAAALLRLIGRMRARATRRLGRPLAVVSCYEAGRDCFWLHRLLVGHGTDNQVMDPASPPVDRRARRVKTDRLDVDALLRALMAWSRGEPRVCSMVRVPSVEEEDARRRTRECQSLVKERLRHTNRIKGLLAGQGIYDFEPQGGPRSRSLCRRRRAAVGRASQGRARSSAGTPRAGLGDAPRGRGGTRPAGPGGGA